MDQLTTVVNCRFESFDVYIGRQYNSAMFDYGNPYTVAEWGREGCLERYNEYFNEKIENDPIFKENILKLKGKSLGCYCKPKDCHGDIIVKWLEEENNG